MTIQADTLLKIANGTLGDADGVVTNTSFVLNQIMVNAAKAGRTYDTTEGYFTDSLTDMIDYSTSTCFTKGDIVFTDYIYDNFDDGSINADIWTSENGTPTEESSGVNGCIQCKSALGVSEEESVIADNTGNDAIDFLDGTDREIILNYEIVSATGSIISGGIQMSDGSNVADLEATGAASTRHTIRIVIDNSGTQALVYSSLTDTSPSVVDLSSLTKGYLRFEVNAGSGGSITLKVYGVGISDGSETSVLYQSAVQTLAAASSTGMSKIRENQTSPVPTYSVSFDNGVNYTEKVLVLNSYTAGASMIAKIEVTTVSSITVTSGTLNAQSMSNLFQLIYS